MATKTHHRVAKVMCDEGEQDRVAKQHSVIDRYEGFLVVRATRAEFIKLAARFPTEDITSQFDIVVGADVIDTSHPRIVRFPKPDSPYIFWAIRPST